jgi:signal transduction histidine kinase
MFRLPVARIGNQEFRFPLTPNQTIRIANLIVCNQDSEDYREFLVSCLRSDAAFLIWITAKACERKVDTKNADALWQFVNQNLPALLASSTIDDGSHPLSSAATDNENGAADNSMSTPGELSRILCKYVNLDQPAARQWVSLHICDEFIVQQQSPNLISSIRPLNLGTLCEKIETANRLSQQFDQAVRNACLVAMKHLAYGASHEINNPLANISTRAESLLAGETHPDRRQRLAMISQQAYRAHEMISDLMLFANPPTLNRQTTDVLKTINQVVAELQHIAQSKSVSVDIKCSNAHTTPLNFDVDPTQIAVAIKAVIQNSIEAFDRAGRVLVTVNRNESGGVNITITDNGAGIPGDVLPFIFDPFFSGREAGRGLGFGLSKAWRILQLHGGTIDVTSDVAEGTQCTIALPVVS